MVGGYNVLLCHFRVYMARGGESAARDLSLMNLTVQYTLIIIPTLTNL